MNRGERVYITGACTNRRLRGKIGTVVDIGEQHTFLHLDGDPPHIDTYVEHDAVRLLRGNPHLVLVKFKSHQTVPFNGKQLFFNAGEQRVARYCNTINTSPMQNVYHDLAWEEDALPQTHFFLWDGVIAIERDLR